MVVGMAVFGAPRFCFFVLWKNFVFSRILAKIGAPQNGRSYHHPSHPPLVTPSEKDSTEPACRSPKVLQEGSGGPLGARTRLSKNGFFSSHKGLGWHVCRTKLYQNFTKVPFVKCFSDVALVPHQVPPLFPSQGHISHCRNFVKSTFAKPPGLANMPFVKWPWSTRMAITNSNDMHKVQS